MPHTDEHPRGSGQSDRRAAVRRDPQNAIERFQNELPIPKIQRAGLVALMVLLLSLAPAWATDSIRIVKSVPQSPAKLPIVQFNSYDVPCATTVVLFKLAYHLDDPNAQDRAEVGEAVPFTFHPPSIAGNLGLAGCNLQVPDSSPYCRSPLHVDTRGDGSCWLDLGWFSRNTSQLHPGDSVHWTEALATLDRQTSGPNPQPLPSVRSAPVHVDYTWVFPPRLKPASPGSVGKATLRPVIPHVVKPEPRPKPPSPYSKSLHTSTLTMHKIGLKPRQGSASAIQKNGAIPSNKLNPQPEPPSRPPVQPVPLTKSGQSGKVTMHKIGLTPRPRVVTSRALPAVQLPSGWRSVGGLLRASRPGLRLRLSGSHTLMSKMGTGGRVSYELLNATGRVVKRISAKASIRLLHGNTLMLQEPTTHRQVLLGRIATTTMRTTIRR